jgi:hypothetical protein
MMYKCSVGPKRGNLEGVYFKDKMQILLHQQFILQILGSGYLPSGVILQGDAWLLTAPNRKHNTLQEGQNKDKVGGSKPERNKVHSPQP